MTAKDSTNAMPVQRERQQAGEHILFMAGIRSNLAKKGDDGMLTVLGAIRPTEPELRDTVKNPDYVTVDASRDRLALASGAGVLEMALDASDTIDSKNSLKKMLVHQMAVLHRQIMRLSARMEDLSIVRSEGYQQRNVEVCRLGGRVARLAIGYQSGFLALQRAPRLGCDGRRAFINSLDEMTKIQERRLYALRYYVPNAFVLMLLWCRDGPGRVHWLSRWVDANPTTPRHADHGRHGGRCDRGGRRSRSAVSWADPGARSTARRRGERNSAIGSNLVHRLALVPAVTVMPIYGR